MADTHWLDIVKKAAVLAVKHEKPCDYIVGTVTSAKPLKIKLSGGDGLELDADFLHLAENVTNHTVKVSFSGSEQEMNIHNALKPQGILVCEFGASGNIATIENAFAKACNSLGYCYEAKFNFPTAEDFGKLLKKNGFVIDKIYEYDRSTVLKDGEQGLVNWMKQFFASELEVMPEHVQAMVFEKVEGLTRETLWNGEDWVADYRRLRAIAHI